MFSVSVRWRLHFEFIIDSSSDKKTGEETPVTEEDEEGEDIPSNIKTESMLWDLPLHVVATNPIQASLMMQAESSETMVLKNS